MSRTINDIYKAAVEERNKRMELKEFNSDSKVSILNGITWTFAAVIQSFEMLLDVFAIDISIVINNRVNGTPKYYANALLQYQKRRHACGSGRRSGIRICDRRRD